MSIECPEQSLLCNGETNSGVSLPGDSVAQCSSVSQSNGIMSPHYLDNHDIGFYVNPLSKEDDAKNASRDVTRSPTPEHANTELQPDLCSVGAFFTREVPVDVPPHSACVGTTSPVMDTAPLPCHTADTNGNKQEFESRLSRVRRSLRRSLSNLRVRKTSPECKEPVPSPPTAGRKMALRDYVSKYSQYLPQQVTIEEGHSETSYEFSAGEVFNFHFIKRTTLVDVRDANERSSVLVPVHGCAEYALLYDPDNNIEKAKVGYTFQTVGNMLTRKTIPKVVRACEGFSGGSERSSVSAREVLLVLKVKKRKFSGPPALVVYSVTKNARKVLQGGCAGKFTTNPILTKLPMSQILKHFAASDLFPCKAMLFMSGSNQVYMNESWFNKDVTIVGLVEDESVIVSSTVENSDGDGRKVYDLQVSCPISVSLYNGGVQHDDLLTWTNEIYSNFNPSTVERIRNDGECAVLAVEVQRNHEKEGLQWKLNEMSNICDHDIADGEGVAEQMASLVATIKEIQRQMCDTRRDLESSRFEVVNLKKEIATMKEEIKALRSQNSISDGKDQFGEISRSGEEPESDIRHMTVISPNSEEMITRM